MIVSGGPMFVALVGSPSTRINILTNVFTSICLVLTYRIKQMLTKKLRPNGHCSHRIQMISQRLTLRKTKIIDIFFIMQIRLKTVYFVI